MLVAFAFGTAVYALLASVQADRSTRLVAWLLTAGVMAWWYSVLGGQWLRPVAVPARKASVVVGMMCLALIGILALSHAVPSPSPAPRGLLQQLPWFQVVYGLIAIPFVEEILFRGLLYGAFAERSKLLAAGLTVAADMCGHWIGRGELSYALAVLPTSLVLTGLRVYTRGIAWPAALHVIIDIVSVT